MSVRELDAEALTEMSMVDLFYDLLKEAQEPVSFYQLYEEIARLKGMEADKTDMARLFTEINIDGRFKPLGDQLWGLRNWYPVEHTEEPVMSQTKKKKKKAKKATEDVAEEDSEYNEVEDIEVEDEDELLAEEDALEDSADLDEDIDEEVDDEYDDDNLGVLDEEVEEEDSVEEVDEENEMGP